MEFLSPSSLESALQAISDPAKKSKLLAGGTALSLMLRQQLIAPQRLVSLHGVPGLSSVRVDASEFRIGAMTRLRDIERSPEIRERLPILAAACAVVGNVRVRNQATLGGNLAEADYASDLPAALLALDASVRVRSPSGERIIPISEFFLGFLVTALEPTEILLEVVVPNLPATAHGRYLKFRSRSSEDRACVAVAAVADVREGVCHELRVAVGAASETPQRVEEAEALARGHRLTEQRSAQIAEAYAQSIEPIEDLRGSAWYRTEMIRVFVARALAEVWRDGR